MAFERSQKMQIGRHDIYHDVDSVLYFSCTCIYSLKLKETYFSNLAIDFPKENKSKGWTAGYSSGCLFFCTISKFLTTFPSIQSAATLRCHWNNVNICGWVRHSATRSKAIWHCNANDCIHQMSFVSYSLCSLSFLSQTPVLLHCAQRCVYGSIASVKPTLIRLSRVPLEWPAKSLCPLSFPHPFVPSVALCLRPWDLSPLAQITVPDSLPQLKEWFAMKGTLERWVISSFFYPSSSFSSEINCTNQLSAGLGF